MAIWLCVLVGCFLSILTVAAEALPSDSGFTSMRTVVLSKSSSVQEDRHDTTSFSVYYRSAVSKIERGFRNNSATLKAAIEGLIRDVSWDVDKRDDNPNSVLDFGTIIAHDKAAAKDLFKYESVRFYCKENVAVDNAGVAEIVIDDENAPVEFYNLNGVRINSDNLVPGLYIRRQGAKASKIIVR